MATIDEVLDKVNQILDAMVYRFFGGTSESNKWGEPVNRSVIVRQEQPAGSGSSFFAIEDLPISEYSIPCRNTGDLVTATLGTDQVLGRISGNIVGIDISTLGGNHNVLSTTHPDTLVDTVVRGDLIAGNATPKWSRLAKGSDDQFLQMSGSDPVWHTLIAGDLPIHTHTESQITDLQDYVRVTGDTMIGDLELERISGILSPTFVHTRYSAGSTNVKDAQSLGVSLYRGYDGTTEELGAVVTAIATQDWGVSAHGCEFEFHVTPDDSTTTAIALRLSSTGATFASPVKCPEIVSTSGAAGLVIDLDDATSPSLKIENSKGSAHLTMVGRVLAGYYKMGVGQQMQDFQGSKLFATADADATAENWLTIAHAADGLAPELSVDGIDDANINFKLTSKGATGHLVFDGLSWPNTDGTVGQYLKTDGAGVLSWGTPTGGAATKRAYTFYFADPQAGKSYIVCKLPVTATIKRVNFITIGTGSTLVFNIAKRTEAAPEAAGTNIWILDDTANHTTEAVLSFDSASVAAHEMLAVEIVSLGGTVPDGFYVGIELEDD